MQVVVITDNGERYDVTDAVQSMYDSLIHSMDWGSQFLSVEEVIPIVRLARLCQFRGYEEAEAYMNSMLAAKLGAVLRDIETRHPDAWEKLTTHDHVYGERGICVWPLCLEAERPLDAQE